MLPYVDSKFQDLPRSVLEIAAFGSANPLRGVLTPVTSCHLASGEI
jgi:hypothetical protein